MEKKLNKIIQTLNLTYFKYIQKQKANINDSIQPFQENHVVL